MARVSLNQWGTQCSYHLYSKHSIRFHCHSYFAFGWECSQTACSCYCCRASLSSCYLFDEASVPVRYTRSAYRCRYCFFLHRCWKIESCFETCLSERSKTSQRLCSAGNFDSDCLKAQSCDRLAAFCCCWTAKSLAFSSILCHCLKLSSLAQFQHQTVCQGLNGCSSRLQSHWFLQLCAYCLDRYLAGWFSDWRLTRLGCQSRYALASSNFCCLNQISCR